MAGRGRGRQRAWLLYIGGRVSGIGKRGTVCVCVCMCAYVCRCVRDSLRVRLHGIEAEVEEVDRGIFSWHMPVWMGSAVGSDG